MARPHHGLCYLCLPPLDLDPHGTLEFFRGRTPLRDFINGSKAAFAQARIATHPAHADAGRRHCADVGVRIEIFH